jgi:hypothetical protein
MLVYVCRIITTSPGGSPGGPGGAPRAVEVADLAWVAPGDLGEWDILPADRPLVERLRVEGVPPN